jgi:hypothetical protein
MRRGIGIPIIIINRDLATWPRAMVNELRRMKYCGPVVIMDNDSTNPETHKWYSELAKDDNAVVIYVRNNGGHKIPWTMSIPWSLKHQFGYDRYIATDPDLDLSGCPDTTIEHLMDLQDNIQETPYDFFLPGMKEPVKFNMLDKIGLAIDISDVPEGAIFYNQEETAYWDFCKPKLPNYAKLNAPPMQAVPVDTTLAIYNTTRAHRYFIGGSRTLDVKMKHLPYYITKETVNDDTEAMRDFRYYIERAGVSSTAKKRMTIENIQI